MKTLWSGLIPVDSIDTVSERVNRVVLRAIKHDFPAPSLLLGKNSNVAIVPGWSVEMVEATIVAPGPLKLGGWQFVGVVSSILEDGTEKPFVTLVPGAEDVGLRVEAVNWCDYCKLNRQRNDTYVVASDAGIYAQVGSYCLKDFTGHDASAMVAYLHALEALTIGDDEVVGWVNSSTRYYDPKAVLRAAARIVLRDGYVNKAKAEAEDIPSTGEMVRRYLSASAVLYADFVTTYPDSENADRLVDATLRACEDALKIDNLSGWGADVSRLATSDGIQWRHVGMVTSAVILGMRKQESDSRPSGESHFLGTIGERITFPVKVTLKREYSGDFGPSFIIRMVARGSDDLLWFATETPATSEIEEGDEFILTGTVKNHELDRRTERPTTIVTRCKVVQDG